jgi:hypothetical protein
VCHACSLHPLEEGCQRGLEHRHSACSRCARSINWGPRAAFGHLYILCSDPTCVSEQDGWVLADDQHGMCWQPCQGHAVRYTSPVELCAERLSCPLRTTKLLTVRWTPGTCRVTPEGAGKGEDMCLYAYLRDYDGQLGFIPRIDASEAGWCAPTCTCSKCALSCN